MADVRWQPPASSLIQAEACQAVVRAQALEHPVGAGPEEAYERGCTAPDRGADVPAPPHLPPLSRSLLPPDRRETGVKVGLPPLRPRPFLPRPDSGKTAAISEKAGNVLRLACKKTKL